MAKQITNGVIPMGAVVAKQGIYDCFMENGGADYMVELPHGYTYSAHPVACAAGLAALDVLVEEGLVAKVKAIAPHFEQAIHSLANCKYVTDIRNYGLAGGITLEAIAGEPALRPYQVAMSLWKKGFYVRCGGDTVQLGLPFAVSKDEIDTLIAALGETLNEQA
ncbi:MAG: aminotransferase class III-fold pyridoxal phosphate-dependent enzyme, partial [Granulosicoccaceae bacterium]